MKASLFLCVISLVLFSCQVSETEPITSDLTPCPESENCSYKYYNNKVYENLLLNNGTYRVFEAKFSQPGISRAFYINAPLNSIKFTITGQEIRDGAVLYNFICPACDYIGLKPIDGKVEGRGGNGGKWLIDATIVLANEQVNYRDTVKIKQYFRP